MTRSSGRRDRHRIKTRFESQLSRMNCQMFSTGLSSGDFGGNGKSGGHEMKSPAAGGSGVLDLGRESDRVLRVRAALCEKYPAEFHHGYASGYAAIRNR